MSDSIHTTDNMDELCARILRDGCARDSRLGPIFEVLGFRVQTPMGIFPARKSFNSRLALAEAMSIISGHFDERIYEKVAKLVHPYTVFQSYGHKIFMQLPGIIDQLRANPGTRRAILHIGQPGDGFETEKPCIQSYQFFWDGFELDMVLNARSWDIMTGLPYDIAVAQMVGLSIANFLGGRGRSFVGIAGSGHLYVEALERYGYEVGRDFWNYRTISPNYHVGAAYPFSSFREVQLKAQDALIAGDYSALFNISKMEPKNEIPV